jgi:TolA-binding protein
MSIKIAFLALPTAFLVSCSFGSPSETPTKSAATTPSTTVAAISTPDPKPDLEQQKNSALVKQRQQEYELLSQKISGQQQRINELRPQADRLEAELSEYNSRVKAYMLENKTEVACMGALGMSLDKTNEYSKDAKDVAALVTLGCGVGVLSNSEFAGNVGKVFNQLVKAGNHSNDLKTRLTEIRSTLTTATTALNETETKAQALAEEMKR